LLIFVGIAALCNFVEIVTRALARFLRIQMNKLDYQYFNFSPLFLRER